MKPNAISYETAGASTFVTALKIFGYSVLAGIMCLFLYFSMTEKFKKHIKQSGRC